MIASIGVRTVVENSVDFKKNRNLLIASVILVIGIGGAMVTIWGNLQFGGMGLAAIIGIILNQILPQD
jgi:uracil permease